MTRDIFSKAPAFKALADIAARSAAANAECDRLREIAARRLELNRAQRRLSDAGRRGDKYDIENERRNVARAGLVLQRLLFDQAAAKAVR